MIGLYIAYVAPVFLRRLNPDFKPGPWNLGKWSALIGWIAVVWVGFICVLFVLPPESPDHRSTTFNYAPVAVIVVVIFAPGHLAGGRQEELHATAAKDEHTDQRSRIRCWTRTR